MIFSCNPHWIEEICDTPAGKACPRETPQAQRRRGRTARGKRVPEVEIKVYKRKGVDL
ncbi:hypothetical protein ABKP09_06645 [Peribacillus frigoritolerans]|uniref:hypothetical protein n=1 Tax=Peribacillus frigoritolerans TaxID=450367 RepID=UPI0032B37619